MTAEGPVVVGVTGRGENTEALSVAAREAPHRGGEIVLVHAPSPHLPAPHPDLVGARPWDETGHAILEDVRQELVGIADSTVAVTTQLQHGSPVEVLTRSSDQASLIVVQHIPRSWGRRLFAGSTAMSVATHAHCPVISVPSRGPAPQRHGRVLVGVHEDGSPAAALEAAFDEASQHGCSLQVSNSWRFARTYDDVLRRDDSWRHDALARIQESVDRLSPRFPDVEVELVVRHEWPDEALVDLSAGADLVVVGRHGTRARVPHFLGSVARGVLLHAACPVMVVPVLTAP
jgi:nucleotide-binding universal stress UspA family protein